MGSWTCLLGQGGRPDIYVLGINGLPSWLWSRPLLLLCLLLATLLIFSLYLALARGARLRALEGELVAMKQMLRDRTAVPTGTKRAPENFEGVLGPELAPMLQFVHELRAPIVAVQNCLDVILQGYGAGDTVFRQEALRLARDRTGALLALVNDLLHLGSVRESEATRMIQPIRLADVVHRVVPEMRIKAMLRGVDLRLNVAHSLPPIAATDEHIEQLVSNLIDNAIKYTDPEGTVTVSLREESDCVIGEVRDTGIGIAAEDVHRIFEAFYRAENAREVEPYGTGLGLPIVKHVVELYGGQLYLESELGKGSRFIFSFPKKRDTRSIAARAVASEAVDGQRNTDTSPSSNAGNEGHAMSTEIARSKECVVIGGGVAGIQAALDLADMGVKVHLVEKQPSIGGRMAQLDKIFPVSCHGACRHCSISLVSHEFGDCSEHPHITLHDYTEVEEVEGSAGEFRIRALKHPRFVDPERCTLCGECAEVCPVSLPDEFNEGLSERRAIYLPHAQAIPKAYLISKRGTAPCAAACPGQLRVQGYISLIAQRRYEEALEVIKEDNPFPATVSRVCDHPCEDECYRSDLDDPVAICALEGFVADWVYGRSQATDRGPQTANGASARVAIVGAGPAGLSAAHFLARMGYRVTVLESLSEPGGVLWRIPDEQLPRDVLQREIDEILVLGVELRLRSPVSDVSRLFDEGYEAIFLATGAGALQHLTLSGEGAGGLDQQMALVINPETMATRRPGVFAGGHAVRESESIIEAVADGRQAAWSIDQYLRGVPLVAPRERQGQPVVHLADEEIVELSQAKGMNRGPRESGAAVDSQASAGDVRRQVQRLTEEQAHAEALRCLRCGICSDCGLCVKVCAPNCIDLQMPAELIELKAGAIIVATGFSPLDPSELMQYGYGRHENVVTSLEYERLVGASGPTGGYLQRPSDGRPVKRLAFIQCVGSRDINYNRFCSSICCMFATQEAIVANERDPEVCSTIFYSDLRAGGKGFQECVDQARNNHEVTYLRARVAEISEDADECPVIWYEDTRLGEMTSETVDLAVLVTGLRPRRDVQELADLLGIDVDEYHFIKTDPFSPMDTTREGIFACGFCCGPADISESVSQASAAAARVAELVLGG